MGRPSAEVFRNVSAGLEDGKHGFMAVRRIIGPSGKHLRWITEETGATLSLKGKGAVKDSNEKLHMRIRARPEDMDYAVRQVEDLFEKIREEFDHFERNLR